MQSSIFMSSRILHEGSNLNIEILEYFQWPKFFRPKNISRNDLLCKANVRFDDLWEHLVSQAQQETNCELIFA